jgi:hypothetical protein
MASFIQTLRMDFSGQEVCVVGHGHSFLLFRKIVEGLDSQKVTAMYPDKIQPNAGVVVYKSRRSAKMRMAAERLTVTLGADASEMVIGLGGDELYLAEEKPVSQ